MENLGRFRVSRRARVGAPEGVVMSLFGWFRARKRRRLLSTPLSTAERGVLDPLRFLRTAPALERSRIEELARVLVARRRWEPCGGLELTPARKLLIAAQAVRLLIGFPGVDDPFPRVPSILVYPGAWISPHERPGPLGVVTEGGVHAGEAWMGGPILLTWDAIEAEARRPEAGHNVVLHEFCHHLDFEDGVADGTPALPDRGSRRAWADVMTKEFDALAAASGRGQATVLDSYGATNPPEFFAVATECFFERPRALQRDRPALYEILKAHYRQDPALRTES